jgi:hypothetical protein
MGQELVELVPRPVLPPAQLSTDPSTPVERAVNILGDISLFSLTESGPVVLRRRRKSITLPRSGAARMAQAFLLVKNARIGAVE